MIVLCLKHQSSSQPDVYNIYTLSNGAPVSLHPFTLHSSRCRAHGHGRPPLDMIQETPKGDYYTPRAQYPEMTPPAQQGDSSMYTSYNGENNYYRTWQLQRHTSGPTGSSNLTGPAPTPAHACATAAPPGGRSQDDSPPRYVEHIYESPKSLRREFPGVNTTSDSLKYFELDPSSSDKRGSMDPLG